MLVRSMYQSEPLDQCSSIEGVLVPYRHNSKLDLLPGQPFGTRSQVSLDNVATAPLQQCSWYVHDVLEVCPRKYR